MSAYPPLKGLRAFEAAARHLSFKKAADELGVTATAVSHAVHGLERYCEAELFRRRPRPLSLTSAGERLFPVLRDAVQSVGDTVRSLRDARRLAPLRITTTNAFAARWLLPRLPSWRELHPEIRLDVIGTDVVLDLLAGEADVAIRYGRSIPEDPRLESTALARDTFHVVASPGLIGPRPLPLSPATLLELPIIEAGWPPSDLEAPTWGRWEKEARLRNGLVPELAGRASMSFAEELHAIEAAITGQGVAICSDVLVGADLAAGRLLRLSDVHLPGYTFHAVVRTSSSRTAPVRAFLEWLQQTVASERPGP